VTEICWFCTRPLGDRIEYHHPVPKSRGGRAVAARGPSGRRPERLLVAVHPICHRTLHKSISNKELERLDLAAFRSTPEIARFP
jgi:hypothetical protein